MDSLACPRRAPNQRGPPRRAQVVAHCRVVSANKPSDRLAREKAVCKRCLAPACGRLPGRYSGLVSTPRYPFVHLLASPEQAPLLSSEAWDLGATGIEERDHTTIDPASASEGEVRLVISFPDFELAEAAVKHFADYKPELVVLEGDEWRDEWKKYFEPSRVSGRLCLQPPWKDWDASDDDVVLTIDPGRAFGTGLHETTRLVLKEIEQTVEGNERVLDVGCGSGILAIAALRLGAQEALCIDNDPDVIPIAKENAVVNGVGKRLMSSATPIEEISGVYDQVYANIQAHVLIPMADALRARVSKQGTLILSGILDEYAQGVEQAYSPWRCVRRHQENEWVALVLQPTTTS